MNYLHRTLEPIFLDSSSRMPVLLVTGPRQIGKTTFLQALAGRVGVVNLLGYSQSERLGLPATPPFLPTEAGLRAPLFQWVDFARGFPYFSPAPWAGSAGFGSAAWLSIRARLRLAAT